MIKINLSNAQKQVDISNIGGFDFSKLKLKAVLLVIGLMYLPDFTLYPTWTEMVEEKSRELEDEQKKLGALKRKLRQGDMYNKQIKELKAQEEALGKKLIAVKEAISIKKNPSPLLLYVAKNTPDGLWIKEMTIDNTALSIKGEAIDYSSIGNFVNSMRASVFIKGANIIGTNSREREGDRKRIEAFEVKFDIARFDQ